VAIDDQTGARLAAYIDGEADEEERGAVELLISRDPELRCALEHMREARALVRRCDEQASTTGADTTKIPPDLSGRRTEHFIFESRIGHGGMGEVYRGTDTSLDRPVAIKLISPTVAAAPRLTDRFVREARVQAQIDHPHVAHVYHVGQYEGRLYFAMEYLPGGSLEDRLEREDKLDPEEAIDIIVEVADILDSTRRHGIVHRDLKPSNIMFTADGKIKLTDFGIAKPTGDDATELTDSGAVVGTPHYISPEAAAGAEVTWRSDMYSLGCTLYRTLFGRPPYRGKGPVQLALAHIQQPFPEPEELPPRVSPELMEVLRCMMAKDPAARFPDYESLVSALNGARPKVIEPISPWKRLGVGLLDSAVTVGLIGVAGAMAAGVLALAGGLGAVQRFWLLVWGAVGVLAAGLIPLLSGNTLAQGIFAMKVRSETPTRQRRWPLFWRGILSNPLATFGLVAAGSLFVRAGAGQRLLVALAVVALAGWHLADFGTAFFDKRRRFLHDVLFRTRLQYVTYKD
jgi:threonine/homoserine/homoserine lactone efflux protein/predicted Ser/Thr protein kinase